jgi:hypothetical protein
MQKAIKHLTQGKFLVGHIRRQLIEMIDNRVKVTVNRRHSVVIENLFGGRSPHAAGLEIL